MSGFSGTRRDVLRRGAAAVGAATVAGNAGCMGLLGSGGGYAQWVPEPGTIFFQGENPAVYGGREADNSLTFHRRLQSEYPTTANLY
jgi:hypothetical protein